MGDTPQSVMTTRANAVLKNVNVTRDQMPTKNFHFVFFEDLPQFLSRPWDFSLVSDCIGIGLGKYQYQESSEYQCQ